MRAQSAGHEDMKGSATRLMSGAGDWVGGGVKAVACTALSYDPWRPSCRSLAPFSLF